MKGQRTPVTISSTVVRRNDLVSAEVAGEVVILSMESNAYVTLDTVGRAIWDMMEEPIAVAEVVAQLSQRYSAPEGQIAHDVIAFLRQIDSDGLVQIT